MLPPDFFPKGYSQSPVRRIADKAFEKEPVGPLPHIGQRRMKHLLVPKKLVNSQDLETCDSPTIPVRTRDQKEVHYEHKTIEKDRDSGMNVSK